MNRCVSRLVFACIRFCSGVGKKKLAYMSESGHVQSIVDDLISPTSGNDPHMDWLRREYARLLQRECMLAAHESDWPPRIDTNSVNDGWPISSNRVDSQPIDSEPTRRADSSAENHP